eukprot:6213681-Pleurochrysis_carterae.AAC.4
MEKSGRGGETLQQSRTRSLANEAFRELCSPCCSGRGQHKLSAGASNGAVVMHAGLRAHDCTRDGETAPLEAPSTLILTGNETPWTCSELLRLSCGTRLTLSPPARSALRGNTSTSTELGSAGGADGGRRGGGGGSRGGGTLGGSSGCGKDGGGTNGGASSRQQPSQSGQHELSVTMANSRRSVQESSMAASAQLI